MIKDRMPTDIRLLRDELEALVASPGYAFDCCFGMTEKYMINLKFAMAVLKVYADPSYVSDVKAQHAIKCLTVIEESLSGK